VEPTQLLGTWQLQRRVLDRLAGLHGTVSGTLQLCPTNSPDTVRWFEQGTFHYAGAVFDAERELTVRRRADGWFVHFADGREFHPWTPGEPVTHPCRADLYRGLVETSPHRLRMLWDVRGPRKDQRMVTRCTRV
jgi:hypothetical protein